jgi:hypothetical protein
MGLQLAEALDMRAVVAHCHLGLGKLYRQTRKCEQAQEHLTTAWTMRGQMGIGLWPEQVAAEMRELT